MNKFHAKRVGKFGSRVEADRYTYLKQLEVAGIIKCLEDHPRFNIGLYPYDIFYTGDSSYCDVSGALSGTVGQLVVEDVKGAPITGESTLRMKYLRSLYPQYELLIVRRVRKQWTITKFDHRSKRKRGLRSDD